MGGFALAQLGLSAAATLAQQQQANKAAKAQANQVAAQNAYLQQQEDVRAKQQRDLLDRQLASTRARLSAGGIGIGSGSAQALMAGMVKDSENQLADSQALLDARQANSAEAASSTSSTALLDGLSLAQKGLGLLKAW